MEIITPRPDFKGALYQFLIGIFQTVYAPKDENEWEDRFNEPPSPDDLKKETDKISFAFDLFGEKIRFMQDVSLGKQDEKSKPIEFLFIDSPGQSTREKNIDLFVKRNTINNLCIHCSATALFTMQINAPEGGAGNYTSLRGGGPLTSILINSSKQNSLWHEVWINVLEKNIFKSQKQEGKLYEFIFPWVSDNFYISNSKSNTTTIDLNLLSVYWSNPRRIFLIPKNEKAICDVCANESQTIITDYKAKAQGIKYGDGGWIHPLTPYYYDKIKDTWLAYHPHLGGILYNHWQSMIYGEKEKDKCAKVIQVFSEYRKLSDEQIRVWTFGYDMESMNAKCWYESIIPIYRIEPKHIEKYEAIISSLLQAATQVANNLQTNVKDAWFNHEARGDLSYLKIEFYKATEAKFYELAKQIRDNIDKPNPFDDQAKMDWLKYLNDESLKIFDLYVESGSIEFENIQRVIEARQGIRPAQNGKPAKIGLIPSNLGDYMKKIIGLPIKEKPAAKKKSTTKQGVKKK